MDALVEPQFRPRLSHLVPPETTDWDEWRADDNRQRARDLHIESRADAWRETHE